MKMSGISIAFIVACLWISARSQGDELTVVVDPDGSYEVQVKGINWLNSAPTFFSLNGVMYSAASGNLQLEGSMENRGADRLGPWSSHILKYKAGQAEVMVSFRRYEDELFRNCVVFGQHFESGGERCSVGDKDKLISGFPSFNVGPYGNMTRVHELGYLAYGGIMLGDTEKKLGRWNRTGFSMVSGRNSGPMALFDKYGGALFISSFTNFMAAAAMHDKHKGTYSWGIMGGVETVPRGFSYHTIMCYSPDGVNEVISRWGLAMRTYFDKKPDYREADLTNNYLSYWSDNGAYYVNYYVKGGLIDNMTYEDAILAVNKYSDQNEIPYRSVQYSVWFEQGAGGGIKEWNASSSLFKDGMQYMYEKTQWVSTAHNRWWTVDTPYAKQNGGKYDWIIEKDNKYTLPIDEQFWMDMFRWSRQWGFICYMQDWLNEQFDGMNITTTTVDVARTWLMQMGKGAQENAVTIQYCMSQARHMLQSLEIPVVTQARASGDYNPAQTQWTIGLSSMFAWAVGIAPFKDTLWTTSVQTNNYYHEEEAHPALQVAVATLSMGPVGPGDKVGCTNKELLMKCCAQDGLILKPSRPAMSIDKQIIEMAFGRKLEPQAESLGPQGEVWTTYSDIGRYRFGIIFAADMKNEFTLRPADTSFGYRFPPSVLYRAGGIEPTMFDEFHPLSITPLCSLSEFCLFYTTPTLRFRDKDLHLLGELSKFVPMSPQRIVDIHYNDFVVTIIIKGLPGEKVDFYYSLGWEIQYTPSIITADGTAFIHIR